MMTGQTLSISIICILLFCGCVSNSEQNDVTKTTQLLVGTPVEPNSGTIFLYIASIEYEIDNESMLVYANVTANISDADVDINLKSTKIIVDEKEYRFGDTGDCLQKNEDDNYFYISDQNQPVLKNGEKISICFRTEPKDNKILVNIAPRVGEITSKELLVEADSLPDEMRYCVLDSDCVSVMPYCLPDCGSGGHAITINKKYEKYWENELFEECRDIGGIPQISSNRTCYSIPQCADNYCELIDYCHSDNQCSKTYLKKLICVNNKCVIQ